MSDFYLRFSPNSSQRKQMLVSRLIVAVSGILAILVALAVTLWEGGIMRLTLDLMAQLSALVLGGATGMFFLGLLTRRANKQGVYAGLFCGFLFTTWAILTSKPALDP